MVFSKAEEKSAKIKENLLELYNSKRRSLRKSPDPDGANSMRPRGVKREEPERKQSAGSELKSKKQPVLSAFRLVLPMR